jgi:NAD(P)-dependent dehydrogenase (short-subunit alcohol dehydrogenase family)
MELAGTSAVVTGGASGLGRATAQRLAAAGVAVVVLDLDARPGPGAVAGDVTSPDDVGAALDQAEQRAPLRLVVSCAGRGVGERVVGRDGAAHSLESFTRVVTLNLGGTFNVLRLAAARMAASPPVGPDGERGVIVNTASIAAFDGQIGQLAYAAAKAGIVGMTLPAARDLARSGIRVVTIAPGTFATPPLLRVPDDMRARLTDPVPFPKRMGDPGEFAALVQHVAENPMLNGETIRLDAGFRMPPR